MLLPRLSPLKSVLTSCFAFVCPTSHHVEQASLQKLKEGLKKASVSLVDVGAARDELLNRAELGESREKPPVV